MRLNKILFYFALCISLLSLIMAVIFAFYFHNKVADFISGICLNIFAGAIILIATSIFDYFLQRRRLLNSVMDKIIKYRNNFSKIKYLDLKENIADYKQYVDYYKKEKDIKIEKKEYDEYKKSKEKEINEKMEEVMNSYIEIAKIDFSDTWLLWDELHFIKPLDKNKRRKWFHKEIFGYLYDLINDIRLETYHFEIFINDFKNYQVNYEKIIELQEKIFYFEEREESDYNWSNDYDKEDIISYSSNAITKKHYIVVNKIECHLTKMFIEVGKINYFSKKYNGKIEV